MIKLQVIFEDETIIVLNKPAGLVVNRSETLKETTLQDMLCPDGVGIGGRAGIVHRLDRETSGAIIVAKTEEAFGELQRQFKERIVKKKYLVLVHGKVTPVEGKITAAIARSPFDRKKFGVFLGGRESETDYRVLEIKVRNFKGSQEYFSFVEVEPKTGRTHQIRVHFKHLGYPVVGDDKYAGRKTARNDRRWCPRQFLHASWLSVIHPVTRERVDFTAPLPPDLLQTLDSLDKPPQG